MAKVEPRIISYLLKKYYDKKEADWNSWSAVFSNVGAKMQGKGPEWLKAKYTELNKKLDAALNNQASPEAWLDYIQCLGDIAKESQELSNKESGFSKTLHAVRSYILMCLKEPNEEKESASTAINTARTKKLERLNVEIPKAKLLASRALHKSDAATANQKETDYHALLLQAAYLGDLSHFDSLLLIKALLKFELPDKKIHKVKKLCFPLVFQENYILIFLKTEYYKDTRQDELLQKLRNEVFNENTPNALVATDPRNTIPTTTDDLSEEEEEEEEEEKEEDFEDSLEESDEEKEKDKPKDTRTIPPPAASRTPSSGDAPTPSASADKLSKTPSAAAAGAAAPIGSTPPGEVSLTPAAAATPANAGDTKLILSRLPPTGDKPRPEESKAAEPVQPASSPQPPALTKEQKKKEKKEKKKSGKAEKAAQAAQLPETQKSAMAPR